MEGCHAPSRDGDRTQSTGSANDLASFSKEVSEKTEGMTALQFSQLREMMERMQKSINGIEKLMDFQCATARELQAVITSQNATMLGLEASVHALKSSRTGVPHFTDFTGKDFSVTLNCPDADFPMETPANSRKCSVDRVFTPVSLASPGHSHGLAVFPSPGPIKRTRITDSTDCDGFVERHGRMPSSVRELEDVKAVSLRRQGSKPFGKTRSTKSKPTPPTSHTLGSSMKPPPDGTPEQLSLAPATGETGEIGAMGTLSPVSPATRSKSKIPKAQSTTDMATKVGKGQMSMEALRQTYDAVVIGTTSVVSPTVGTVEENGKLGQSAFPCLGRFLLCLVGHLQFGTGWPSWLFSFFSSAVVPVSLTALLFSSTAVTGGASILWNMTMALTLSFFQLGISFASVSFKLNDMDLLLGPAENQLDDYAEGRGFMKDWQRLSRRRLVETVCVLVCMLIGRTFVSLALGTPFRGMGKRLVADHGFDVAVFSWCMWLMIIRFLLLCYSFLHISCGLELALDSFTLRFFNELDIEEALEEWNVLQATLRQVSSKMSSSLLAIGFCALAGLAILAEHVMLRSDEDMEIVTSWLLRFYPLILFFLYSIMRAAEVTEKASRVAPLVNSWYFDHEDGDSWMDPGRQYAVQYINQSRAGFYLRGTQLTMPTAQRISYYFAALSMALLSRLFT